MTRQFNWVVSVDNPAPVAPSERDRHQWLTHADELPPTNVQLRQFLESYWPGAPQSGGGTPTQRASAGGSTDSRGVEEWERRG